MNKKDIILVHTTINIFRGIGSVIKNLIYSQQQEYYKVFLAVPSDLLEKAKELFPNINVIENCEENRWLKYIIRGTNLNGLKEKIEMQYPGKKVQIICHGIGTFGILSKVPLRSILVLHGRMTDGLRGLKTILYSLILRHAKDKKTLIVSVSENTKNFYKAKFNVDSFAVNNCANVKNSRKKHNVFTIGFAGCLDENKGYKFIIKAAHILREQGIANFCVKMAGENWENDEIYNLIDKFNLQNTVIYLGDVDNYSEKELQNIDLMVLPSLMEGLPMTLLEAQSLGIPILATKVGGIPELLKDGYNGYFINRDEIDIANKIKLCMNEQIYSELSENSLYISRNEYSLDKMLNKYDQIIEKSIGNNL